MTFVKYYLLVHLLYQINDCSKVISPMEFGLDKDKIYLTEYIFKNLKQIKSKIQSLTEEELKYYSFIEEKEIKKDVTIFEYESFLMLNKNKYFGESAI